MASNDLNKREISFCSRESTNTSNGEEGIEDSIEITINSIENIIRDSPLSLKFIVEHDDTILGESELIKINPSYGNISQVYPIDFMVPWSYKSHSLKSIAPIVSTPILIKVFEISETVDLSPQVVETKGGKNKTQSKLKRSSSKIETKIETKLFGMCNVDLLPIILGEIICDEKLVLDIPPYSWDNRAVSWANLPRISVAMSISDDSTVIITDSNFNFLNITVESIYNVPSFFTSDMEYTCGTVLDTENNEDSRIIFEAGKMVEYRDVERTKTWKPLQHVDSRAKFSKYKISCDYDIVKNEYKEQFNLKEACDKGSPRIEWNAMQRTLLGIKDIENIKYQIKKYKYWPFQIMVTQKQRSSKDNGIEEAETQMYQCYVDASQLLFPGRTKARILAQLHTLSPMELEEKTGLTINIFDDGSNPEPRNSKRSGVSAVSDSFFDYLESEEHVPSNPVFTETGEPVLLLIEFTLYRPFLVARVLEDYTIALEALKRKPKSKTPCYVYTPDLAQMQYVNCIQYLNDVLEESYQDFMQQCECKESEESMPPRKFPPSCSINKIKSSMKTQSDAKSFVTEDTTCPYFYIEDELSRFKQFLHESGKYVEIRSTLKSKIINLLDQKFAMNSSEWYSTKNQNFVASCYTYLVEQMHIALNTKLDVRFAEKYPEPINPEELWLRAEEAYELEDYEKSQKLIGKIVSDNRECPNSWLKYASFFMRRGNIDEAIECCRESIRLDSRHRLALIFYGIILAMKEEYTEAEVFLKGVTHLYPRFAEAWAILHLFYVKIQYYPGIDITLSIAEKCLKDRTREIDFLDISKEEPIAWSTMLCRNARIFHLTAVLLMKMHLYNFAALALTQDVCHSERTVEALYFLGVNYYLQGNYEAAIEHLNEADDIIGLKNNSKEYSVAALMGHSYYKAGDLSRAIECYDAVDMMYDRPENIHLVHLRMGFYYLDVEEYERARNIFLRASKESPSCRIWLGVGVSSYHLKKLDESEIALTEANRIDGEDPEVWGYLCLLSMSLHRYEEFTQCYRQMVKNNLRSDKLWRLITHSMDTLGYSSPITDLKGPNKRFAC